MSIARPIYMQQLINRMNNGMIKAQPYPQDSDGEIIEIPFLGGLMHGYLRSCKAA